MLTLNDGRSELWQWDTGRKLSVDADCSQVHFSNKVFGRSVDVDVVDGIAVIPDILLQTDKELTAWAFVGTAENGYTKISKVFKVNKRNKPADYVFTPQDQSTLGEILDRIEDLENRPSGDVSKEDIQNAVNDYLDKNPVSFEEKDPTVPNWAKQPNKPSYTAAEVGALPADTPIPEGIPIPSSAQVGQTIVVKAVDENGKPTEWEPGNAGAKWTLVRHLVVEEAVASLSISSDEAGNPISDKKYSEMYVDYYIPGLGEGNYSSRFGSISFWFNGDWGGGTSVDFSNGGNGYDGIRSAVHAVRPPIQGVGLSIETPIFYAIMVHTGRIQYAVFDTECLAGVNIRNAAGITAGSVFDVYAR